MEVRPKESGGGPAPVPPGLMDFAIRRVREGDERALAEFYGSLSEASTRFFEPYRDKSVAGMAEVVRRAVAGEDLSLIVQDASGRVLGHIFFMNVGHEVPHLGIGLRDDCQNCGLGSALFVYLIGLGRHVLKKRTIGLTVMKENRRALHVYRKYGFQVVRDVTFRTPDDSHELWLTFEDEPAESGAVGIA